MWANAQRHGRPAEYRWRPLFNAAKFGCRPLLECRAVSQGGGLLRQGVHFATTSVRMTRLLRHDNYDN